MPTQLKEIKIENLSQNIFVTNKNPLEECHALNISMKTRFLNSPGATFIFRLLGIFTYFQ